MTHLHSTTGKKPNPSSVQLVQVKSLICIYIAIQAFSSNRHSIVAYRSSNAKTNLHTHTHSQHAPGKGFFFSMICIGYESQKKRWTENMLGTRGCSHKSVYWAVPETCRQTLGSRYQICNPISSNAIFAEAPHASSRHSLNSHVHAVVGSFTHRCFQQ